MLSEVCPEPRRVQLGAKYWIRQPLHVKAKNGDSHNICKGSCAVVKHVDGDTVYVAVQVRDKNGVGRSYWSTEKEIILSVSASHGLSNRRPAPYIQKAFDLGQKLRGELLATDILPLTQEGFKEAYDRLNKNRAICKYNYPRFRMLGNIDITNAHAFGPTKELKHGINMVLVEHIYPWRIPPPSFQNAPKFNFLRDFWTKIWRTIVAGWNDCLVIMVMRKWEVEKVLWWKDDDGGMHVPFNDLPDRSKRVVRTQQHYNSQRMSRKKEESWTTVCGQECTCLVHTPRSRTIWNEYPELQFEGWQDSEWLLRLTELSLMHGNLLQFSAYTLESSVAITEYLNKQGRLWFLEHNDQNND